MKLKKIASLMLAGVMAVSMLAGCSTADVAPTPDPDPEEPSATSYSAVMQNAFESKDIMKIHFADDSNLDKALEAAVGYAGYDAVTNDFLHQLWENGKSVQWIGSNLGGGNSSLAFDQVNLKLRDAMGTKIAMQRTDDDTVRYLSPESKANAANEPAWYDKNDVNTTVLYVADRGMSLEAAMDAIADEIATGVKGLNTYYDHIDTQGTTYHYEYTGSVSVCSKNFDAMNGIGVNFIAVNIVRTIVY